MPMNGNSHPMPGHLVPDNNLFIMPDYPAMGWNEAPGQGNVPGGQHGDQANTVMMNEPVMPDLHVPPVDVMQAADAIVQDFQQEFMELDANPERAIVLYSPPILQQFEQISQALCAIQSKAAKPTSHALAHTHGTEFDQSGALRVQSSVQPDSMAGKRSWSDAFEQAVSFSVTTKMDELGMDADKVFHSVSSTTAKGKEEVLVPTSGAFDEEMQDGDSSIAFVAAPVATIKKRKTKSKKAETPLVDTSIRRRTRGAAAKKGYRVPPITDIAPKPCKRSRKAAPVASAGQQGAAHSKRMGTASEPSSTPRIPVATLQKIGDMLGIDQSLLTVDKLTAVPKQDDASKSD
ncbi:hypothetical protein ACQ4PT_023665 [Festuca glaucescens]